VLRRPAKTIARTEGLRSPCPIGGALDILGDRWTLLVMRDLLFYEKRRFAEMLASPEGIASNILADRLERLERCGLVERRRYQDRPPREEYHATERGQDLIPLLRELTRWGQRHIPGTAKQPPTPLSAAVLALIGRYERERGRLTHRLARLDDVEDLEALMDAAIAELQKPFLDGDQIASSRAIMGLDTQLIEDGTYFVVTMGGDLAGCGGWSRRATLYGSHRTAGRSPARLDPAIDPARIRAMYTHPNHVRKGVGRLIIALCEAAALAEGFTRMELMSTMCGEALYRACGYEALERVVDDRGGVPVPLVRMAKVLGERSF